MGENEPQQDGVVFRLHFHVVELESSQGSLLIVVLLVDQLLERCRRLVIVPAVAPGAVRRIDRFPGRHIDEQYLSIDFLDNVSVLASISELVWQMHIGMIRSKPSEGETHIERPFFIYIAQPTYIDRNRRKIH
ncbi:unnamed protein product [Ectocarpus sp. 6 AP-2014]